MNYKNIRLSLFTILSVLCSLPSLIAQNISINNTGAPPAASAALDMNASNKGLLIPRLTAAQRDLIASPANGLLIYDASSNQLEFWNDFNWVELYYTQVPAVNGTGTTTGRSVSISNSATPADPSAMLDIQSTTGGLLIPRLSTVQRNAITTPVPGLLIYNTDYSLPEFYTNAGWVRTCGIAVSSYTGTVTTKQNMGINTASPDSSAMLDITSTNAGLALPRLSSAQRDAILSPAQGLVLFNTTTQSINIYNGAGIWLDFNTPSTIAPPVDATNDSASTQITWRWHPVNGASGYKWSTGNNYQGATDLGADTFLIQTQLTCNTVETINVWAYNCNAVSYGVAFTQSTGACATGNECSWNGSNTFTDTRDGQTYTQVQIGTQCWMAQDLNYGTYQPLPSVNQTVQPAGVKYCDNVATNANDSTCPYGGLYQWANLMNGAAGCNGTGAGQPACDTPAQGLCPNGWHIPSHYEWTLMENTINHSSAFPYDESSVSFFGTNEGDALKTAGTGSPPMWPSGSNGNNSTGFSAMPAGLANTTLWIGGPYELALWTSSENTNSGLGCSPVSNCAWYHFIYSTFDNVARYIAYKQFGYSVRCVKN